MTNEPVSRMPDPKYAGMTDDTIRGLEERLERKYVPVSDLSGDGFGVDPDCAEAAATLRVLRADLRTALAQLDEARAELAMWQEVKHSTHWKARAEAAEARLEELTRDRDEAFVDDHGTTWKRPTAWAYYAACKARDAHIARLEEAKAVLGRAQAWVSMPIRAGNKRGTPAHDPSNGLWDQIDAFLHQGGSE